MTNQHDPIDTWLEREVTPLMPRPGSLDRIRTRARRRKRNQAFVLAAGCAVIVGAAAAVPQIASALQSSPGPSHPAPPAALGSSAPSVQSSSRGSTSPETATDTPSPQHSTLATGSLADDPVPAGFHPTSVTFVGKDNGSGGVVGAVIGQAGNHECATQYCTSLAQTPDYGSHWFGLAAPEVGAPQGSTGVSQVRFASLKDGWAFGPGLQETTAGGWPWTREDTFGQRVLDLETADGRAFAVFASCSGASAAYASDCTSFRLYTSATGSPGWTPASVPYPFVIMKTSAPSSATIAIGGSSPSVYVLTPSGELLSSPLTGGSFTEAGKAPCQPGPAQAGGAPSQAHLSAYPTLVLACDSGSTTTIWKSADGAKWSTAGVLNAAGSATSLTSAPGGNLVVATTGGLYYSADGGKQWQTASVASSPAGGFSYVGMTNAMQGVALPADSSLAEIFVTTDGGHTWTTSPVRSP